MHRNGVTRLRSRFICSILTLPRYCATLLCSMRVETVLGSIPSEDLGVTLPHEHIMVDFIGAAEVSTDRYKPEEVIAKMEPMLRDASERGVRAFFDCTPNYLGRDPELLAELSRRTGVRIITNTGWYRGNWLPERASTMTAEEIAAEWIAEARDGIDGTGIRPGFIKTAVDPGPLETIERKCIQAAAYTSKATGLTIATHCGSAPAAGGILDILEAADVSPSKWIFVHGQAEQSLDDLVSVARRGCWIELDGIQENTVEKHIRYARRMLDEGFVNRVLLSHDGGWFDIGKEPGGTVRPFTVLHDVFLPKFLGASDPSAELEQQLTVENPAAAYGIVD